MKNLIKKINKFEEQIEMGFYTKKDAIFKLKELRSKVAQKFPEDSDEFIQCIHALIDAYEAIKKLDLKPKNYEEFRQIIQHI